MEHEVSFLDEIEEKHDFTSNKTNATPTCQFCGKQLMPRQTGGKRQVFCTPKHRVEFHRLCRLYGLVSLERGWTSLDQMKAALANVYVGEGPI